MTDDWFFERRETLSGRRRSQERRDDSLLERGASRRRSTPQGTLYEATTRVDTAIAPAEWSLGDSMLGGAAPVLQQALDALEQQASRHQLRSEIEYRASSQRVWCKYQDVDATDLREHFILEIRLCPADGKQWLQRELAFRSLADLQAATGTLGDRLSAWAELAQRKQQPASFEPGPMTVVIPPGADAGVLLHELCGHPLEGDVAVRRSSFLARARGARVAPEWVTVTDGPARGVGLSQHVDDEGIAARETSLIAAGIAGEPLLDRESAERQGLPSNGHGRRVSFRTPPIARMSHTELKPYRGSLEDIVGEVERGLLVRYLTPRHVHLLSGDFAFFAVEAQRIDRGKIGAFIGSALLRGNALKALSSISRVGADLQPFFGLKGCGKLDHGPLPVSFGNPTVRIDDVEVVPWT